jgi:hypothetical protein
MQRLLLAACFASCSLSVVAPGLSAQQVTPDYRVVVEGHFDAETLAAFSKRVQDYAALRRKLEEGLPPLRVTTNADEIEAFERGLARRLRDSRGSHPSRIFSSAMRRQIRWLLVTQADAGTIEMIMDDNPGEFGVDINETYSKDRPVATMPPKILQLLPDLPRDVEYRFVGRHLILYDVRANMVVDEIPYALRCRNCALPPEDDH